MLWFLVWAIAVGLFVFVLLYVFVARAYRTWFGLHFLGFMLSLLIAFSYALLGSSLSQDTRRIGWEIVLLAIAGGVWLQVVSLASRLIRSRRRVPSNE